MEIRENVPIATLTTMRLGGDARYVIIVNSRDDVAEAVAFAEERNLPIWVMGEGANTIGHDEGFPGVIILNQLKGIHIDYEQGDTIVLTAMGGEIWDDLVRFVCERDYTGIEAMSAIPGTVGAAPVQNIGAYGQDIAQVIEKVEALDLRDKQSVTLTKSEMKMGYRHTRFNYGEDAGRYIITSVTIRLRKGELKPPFYNSLQRYIEEHHEADFSPRNIRRMVMAIRSNKLPDPKIEASAGSFFKNVQVPATEITSAQAQGIPVRVNADWSGKINSGWLIEQCGLKGKELYGFRVSEKAALILINENAKSYADLAKARTEIINTVRAKFGYTLEQEPVEIPVEETRA